MKTFLPILKLVLTSLLLSTTVFAQSGPGGGPGSGGTTAPEFNNWSLEPGSTAGAVGAVYRFHSVLNNVDALVKINDRSSNKVKLINIDLSGTGYDKALQPVINYNDGSTNSSNTWWMEFEVKYVQKDQTTAVVIPSFYSTAVDIDGDGNHLHEIQSYYSPAAWTLESVSSLTVSNFLQMLLGLLTPVGKTFDGVLQDHSGIDTTATELMATMHYTNVSNMKFRIGAATQGGGASNTERQYSIYFKNFSFAAPITLPVKLASFTATLNKNNKAELKWTTASEINTSHFVVERSTDGVNFSDAGLVFAYGSTSDMTNYSFPDDLSGITSTVVYYRLRSVDNDGKSQYSETRMLRLNKQSSNTISIVAFPNPVANELRVSIPNEWQNKKVVFEVLNANGQLTQRMETASSGQTQSINTSSLSSGFYLVRVSCEGQSAQQKIVKQ